MRLTEQQIKDGALRFSRKDVNHQTNFINAVNWAQGELNNSRFITEDDLKDWLFEFDDMEEWWNKAMPKRTIISVKIGDDVEVCVFGGGFTDSYDATGCKTLKDLDNLIKLFS